MQCTEAMHRSNAPKQCTEAIPDDGAIEDCALRIARAAANGTSANGAFT